MKTNHHPAFRAKILAAAVGACFSAALQANPVGPAVVNGTATFNQQDSTLTITNSNGAIINWQGFSIGANEVTRFVQSSAASSVLNRVVTQNPSTLLGALQSNGRVFLINPAGIMVGQGARIDVAGFVASTLHLSDQDFLAGKLDFTGIPGAGNVTNAGTITTPTGGSVYLLAPNVENSGTITTPAGETILAAGQTVQIIDSSTPGVKVEITGDANQATNLGEILAESGRIGVAGVLVKNSGTLNANSAVSEGGRIFLKATRDAIVDGNSRISATGTKGGQIDVLGDRVAVTDNAQLDVSGRDGGGTVRVGGDYQGKNPDVQNAQIAYFGRDARIKADAADNGNGGKVIVWSDDTTRAYGSISAKGGTNGGDGGFVEVSGKQNLEMGAAVDTRADKGTAGTLLLDPTSITITSNGGSPSSGSFSGNIFDGAANSVSTMGWDYINGLLSGGNVVIQTSSAGAGIGNIDVTGSGVLAGSAYSLSLLAENGLTVNTGASIYHSGSGNLTLVSGWNPASGYINPTADHASNPGDMTIAANVETNPASTGSITIKAKGSLNITDAMVTAGGAMNVEAGSINIDAVTNSAGLFSKGNQAISLAAGGANGILELTSTIGSAQISTNGSQDIDFYGSAANTLWLQGSNSNTASYGNSATIKADGLQRIRNLGGSLTITLNGGTGTAATGGDSYRNYGLPTQQLVCTGCATFNEATIRSKGGQTITATSITLTGGSGGNGNGAQIENESTAAQTITTSDFISLTGGTGGIYIPAVNDSVSNDAGIDSNGTQTINAGSITMVGGGDSTTQGGAFLGGKTAQSITTSGNLSMTGGASLSLGQYGIGAPAIIGEEFSANIDLNVGGTLTMTGGTGISSPALIGSAQGTPTIAITAASISMNSGTGGAGIGVLTGVPAGTLSMTTTSGITQDAASKINTAVLSASASAGSINLGRANLVNTVTSLSASGNINYGSSQSVHIGSATSTGGNTELLTWAGDLYLGTASGTAVTVGAAGAVYDDNGTANNITATSSASLFSLGAVAGSLGISADVDTPNLSATVSGSYGGISIRSTGASAPATIAIADSAVVTQGVSFFRNGALTLNGSTTFSSLGSVNIGASGAINVGPFTPGVVAGQALSISTPGDINITGNVTSAGDLKLAAANLNMTGGSANSAYNFSADISGNMLVNESTITAGNRADLILRGAASALTLNDAVYGTPARINAGSAIKVDLLGRSSGGVVIDGEQTLTTSGSSGFFLGGTPAVRGAGLSVTYGLAATNTVQDLLAASVTSTSPSSGTTSDKPILLATATTTTTTTSTSGGLLGDTTQTTGGTTGTFGGTDTGTSTDTTSTDSASTTGTTDTNSTASTEGDSSNSEEDKKSAKGDQDSEGEKKENDKSKDKKYGQCS